MEEMDLKELLNYFISKKEIIIIFAFSGLFLMLLYSGIIKKPMYNSYTTIVLAGFNDNTNENNNAITDTEMNLNQKLTPTYSEIMKSKRILKKVINNLNLDISDEELSNQIDVSNINNTEIIKISVNSGVASTSKDIANEIAKVFSDEIVKIYSIKNVSIIDAAVEAKDPYNKNIIKDEVIAFGASIILGFIFIFIMFYFDTTIKGVEEIEEKIGLPVLGTVPINTKSGGKR